MNNIKLLPISHGCRKCAEVSQGFYLTEEGVKMCASCKTGRVYFLQEAFDLIKDLDLQLDDREERTFPEEEDPENYV